MQFWKPGDIYEIECPQCNHPVEFFKDDIRRKCKNCGHRFINPKFDLGCAKWCQYAEQCVGLQGKEDMKKNLIEKIRDYFKNDRMKIDHSLKVTEFAEKILESEQGNPRVVIGAALLHITGNNDAEKKYEDMHSAFHTNEVSFIARQILEDLDWEGEIIEQICTLLQNHLGMNTGVTINDKILHDAEWLTRLQDAHDTIHKDEQEEKIARVFLTDTGRKIAQQIFA